MWISFPRRFRPRIVSKQKCKISLYKRKTHAVRDRPPNTPSLSLLLMLLFFLCLLLFFLIAVSKSLALSLSIYLSVKLDMKEWWWWGWQTNTKPRNKQKESFLTNSLFLFFHMKSCFRSIFLSPSYTNQGFFAQSLSLSVGLFYTAVLRLFLSIWSGVFHFFLVQLNRFLFLLLLMTMIIFVFVLVTRLERTESDEQYLQRTQSTREFVMEKSAMTRDGRESFLKKTK